MKVLITGSNGTLGSRLKKYLKEKNIDFVGWNRKEIPIDDYHKMENFIKEVNPDILFHLAIASQSTGKENEGWLVNYEWSSELAWITKILNIKFVYTSTAMVFSNDAKGPFTIDSIPDAKEGYGYEKRISEEKVFYQNSNSIIARLGWQIGDKAGSNNMIDFFEKNMKENGVVKASTKWLPACSFLDDTVESLFKISQDYNSGLFMIDSNKEWNFYEIASALNKLHGDRWNIEATEDFVYDQRMIDERINIHPLSKRLHLLS